MSIVILWLVGLVFCVTIESIDYCYIRKENITIAFMIALIIVALIPVFNICLSLTTILRWLKLDKYIIGE